jgi:hypothetical protein
MSYGDFRDQRNKIYCDAEFSCCSDAQPRWGDSAGCVKTLAGEAGTQSIANGISSGQLSFDAGRAAKCLDAMKSLYASCDQTIDPALPECDGVVVGLAAVGKPCGQDIDCVPAAFCQLLSALNGTCAARAKMGEGCSGTPCTTGLACLPGNTCGKPLDTGEVCEASTQCKSRSCVGNMAMADCAGLPTLRLNLCGS